MTKGATELKVGAFAAAVIVLLAWATVKVNDKSSVSSGGYELKAIFDNAIGLKIKAPVVLAGVQIGVVKRVELTPERKAKADLIFSKDVVLPSDSKAMLRTRGFLGETYVEIVPGIADQAALADGGQFEYSGQTGDMNSLINRMNEISDDVKFFTGHMRTMVGSDEGAPINRIIANLDQFAKSIRDVTVKNSENIDRITANLAAMTETLKLVVENNRGNVDDSMDSIASITRKIDEGQGTIGKLVNDQETVNKLNAAADSLNEALGGFKKLETEFGYHTEYLTKSSDFKHYISLSLKPTPDKAFLVDVVSDPNPNPSHIVRTTDVTVGGNTSTVTTDTATVERNKVRLSAQLAKKFYDFTVRGGLIESTGGLGVDYDKGPLGVSLSAFDFSTRYGEKPHLKLMGNVNVTKNFYVVGGADDFISRRNRPDWFMGAGLKLVDDDIKKLATMGGASLLGK